MHGRSALAVEGSGELRPLRDSANQLAVTLEQPVRIDLRTIPSQVESSRASRRRRGCVLARPAGYAIVLAHPAAAGALSAQRIYVIANAHRHAQPG